MAYLIQFRRDTLANWNNINPILADAEIGFILDVDGNGNQKSSMYKIGDGSHPWNELPLFGFNGNISEVLDFDVNNPGDDGSNSVLSKKAIIDNFISKSRIVDDFGKGDNDSLVVKSALEGRFNGIDGNITTINTKLETAQGNIASLRDQQTKDFKKLYGDENYSSIANDDKSYRRGLVIDVYGYTENIEGGSSTHHNGLIDDVYGREGVENENGLVKDVYGWTKNGEPQLGLVDKVSKLESKLQILSKSEFDGKNPEDYEDGTLFFLY